MSAAALDVVTRTAPFGVRPRDAVSGRAVTDGLVLRETRSGAIATANRSGVLVFHDLPGLHDSAAGRGDDPFWATPPARGRFELELVDRAGRYLPCRFSATAPERTLRAASPAPAVDVRAVGLYSAPSRPVPAAVAAVRAELWDAERDGPAAGAVLEVTPGGGAPALGIADERGRVLVLLPYPEPRSAAGGPAASRALADTTWSVRLGVRYDGAALPAANAAPAPRFAPDLDAVLGQAGATLLEDATTGTPLTAATLAFDRQLSLRSLGRSVLLIFPMA